MSKVRCLSFLATTSIGYHFVSSLSRTFFIFLKVFDFDGDVEFEVLLSYQRQLAYNITLIFESQPPFLIFLFLCNQGIHFLFSVSLQSEMPILQKSDIEGYHNPITSDFSQYCLDHAHETDLPPSQKSR